VRRRAPYEDPVLLAVAASRLGATLAEQQAALIRTAFSSVLRDSLDLACGLFDTRGQMVAQSMSGTPGHINAMATGVRHFAERFPPATLAPGDVLVTNDPWLTAGQLNDITVVTPIFHADRVVGFFANTCHTADIGGRGLSGEASDVYEEGLQIPMRKLADGGVMDATLIDLLRANVRMPDEAIGDLYAQVAANDVGAASLAELLDELRIDELDPLASAIIDRSEAAMRRAIGGLADGTCRNSVWGDGLDEPVELAVTIDVRGDEIAIDFAGSAPQSRHAINVVLNYTRAYASFALKALLAPDVPHNAGSFRPVHVTAPERSILNCVRPAAVASRHLLGHMIPGLIFGALEDAAGERLLAGSADGVWLTIWRGRTSDGGEYLQSLFQNGGMGARPGKDGLSATGFPTGVGGTSTELLESLAPLVHRRRTLRTDSGGAGRWRGGLGQVSEMESLGGERWSVCALVDRTRFAAPGVAGGGDGALGELEVSTGGPLPPKRGVALDPGARVTARPPGGGGYGDPFDRPPELVLDDVLNGYVSMTAAREVYGVVVEDVAEPGTQVRLPGDFVVDEAATAALRVRAP
jgi:N-methylhydantoinase B